jgi:hypothetical protein
MSIVYQLAENVEQYAEIKSQKGKCSTKVNEDQILEGKT